MSVMRIRLGPRAQAAILMTLVGALGIVVGIGIERLRPTDVPATEGTPAVRRPGQGRGADLNNRHEGAMARGPVIGLNERLRREVDLTPAQEAALDSIMAENRTRVRALMREYQPHFRAIVEDTRRAIDSVLTEEQRERLRELQAERRARWRERRD